MEKSKKRRESTDLFNDDEPLPNNSNLNSTSTPIRANNRSEDEDSPYFPCSTQEMRDDVDVLWDYNSPRTKPKVWKKSKKKLSLQQSPKVPFRRHPSANNEQIKQDFCKLREELRALRAEIAKPDHEESLVLSPREEEAFKYVDEHQFHHIEEHIDDPFDDDMDDKLLLCSQQIESELNKVKSTFCDTKDIDDQKNLHRHSDVFNDTFENVMSQMNECDFDQLTQVVDIKKYKDNKISTNSDKNSKAFCRSLSEDKLNFKGVQTMSGKVEWHRTQSFESYANVVEQLSKDKVDEIEKKRLQAKAKLDAKKKQVEYSDSPLKCSPQEIEKKRLQALAKLEAKRQKEIMEKKKQEALKRREENRRINASQVRSSLSTRL